MKMREREETKREEGCSIKMIGRKRERKIIIGRTNHLGMLCLM